MSVVRVSAWVVRWSFWSIGLWSLFPPAARSCRLLWTGDEFFPKSESSYRHASVRRHSRPPGARFTRLSAATRALRLNASRAARPRDSLGRRTSFHRKSDVTGRSRREASGDSSDGSEEAQRVETGPLGRSVPRGDSCWRLAGSPTEAPSFRLVDRSSTTFPLHLRAPDRTSWWRVSASTRRGRTTP